MTTALITIGIVGVLGLVAYLLGKASEQKDVAQKAANVAKKQTIAALEKPDKKGLIERLKRGKF